VGAFQSDAATSRLRATGVPYVVKKLESNPRNWRRICTDYLVVGRTVGALVKITAANVKTMRGDRYVGVVSDLFVALAKVPHLIVVHEELLGLGDPDESRRRRRAYLPNDLDEDELDFLDHHLFPQVTASERDWFFETIEAHDLNVTAYRTNAELAMLTGSFVEQCDNQLAFRLYVPVSRLWSREADKLLALFREWLTKVKGARVLAGRLLHRSRTGL
jgi:hypothetical protein